MADHAPQPQTGPPPIAGLLVVDKPLRVTSMSVCRRVRARLREGGAPKGIKVGHGGTLDPLATGVLVVLVGRATRLQDQVMGTDKRYVATVDLAHVSPTDDLEAEPVAAPVPDRTPEESHVRAVLDDRFTGVIQQAPPAHSAVKVEGARAYELARAGRLDRLEPRPVRIDRIDIARYAWPELVLDVRCGKGTYIRSLARDVGIALGTGGMLVGLRRTAVGPWTIDRAQPSDDIPSPLLQEHLIVTPGVEAIWRTAGFEVA